jgi:trans-aconitate methyltransferase
MGASMLPAKDPTYLPYTVRDTRLERALRSIVQNHAPEKDSLKVLDYGSGYGLRSESIVHYLQPRQASVTMFDIDPNLLIAARERLGKITQVNDFVSGQVRFDLLLCLSVLEMIPDNRVVAQALSTLRANMDRNSLLVIQHVNWHPLAARTGYWFLKSLVSPKTFGSAIRKREEVLGYRNYSTFTTLLGMIADAGLKVDRIISGPYVAQTYLPVPHSIRERNLLLVSAVD